MGAEEASGHVYWPVSTMPTITSFEILPGKSKLQLPTFHIPSFLDGCCLLTASRLCSAEPDAYPVLGDIGIKELLHLAGRNVAAHRSFSEREMKASEMGPLP